MSVLSVCLSPGLQRSVCIDALALGEVNRLQRVEVDVAGKGVNVCRALQRLGVSARCLAQGGDNAAEVLALAVAERLNLRLIPSCGRMRTCTSIIELAVDGGRRVTELVEPTAPVDAACVAALGEAVQTELCAAEALVIAGSMAPGFPTGYQAQLARYAKAAGVPVAVDLQGEPLLQVVAEAPVLVKINLSEFAATFLDQRFAGGEQSGVLAAPVLPAELIDAVGAVSMCHVPTFVLTRGPSSILLARAGEVRMCDVTPLPTNETLSTIGCGDTFLAALLAKMLAEGEWQNEPLSLDAVEAAIDFAVACAQANARTLRPGVMDDGFPSLTDKIR